MYDEMMDTIGLVGKADPELAAAMGRELTRQRENIELIASENIVSPAVMAAMGTVHPDFQRQVEELARTIPLVIISNKEKTTFPDTSSPFKQYCRCSCCQCFPLNQFVINFSFKNHSAFLISFYLVVL